MKKGQKKGELLGIIKFCLSCKHEIYVTASATRSGRGKYCSRRCAKLNRPSIKRIGIIKECLMCGSKFYSPDWLSKKNGGKYCSRTCYWKSKVGLTPWNYEGKSTEAERIRKSSAYKLWRKSVFERDRFTCQFCGQVGGDINADHIMPFSLFPDMRFDITNGRTLCVPCHRETDTYGRGSVMNT